METTDTKSGLRVVGPDEADGTPVDPEPATEAYWTRVQALRDDLARLRPAN